MSNVYVPIKNYIIGAVVFVIVTAILLWLANRTVPLKHDPSKTAPASLSPHIPKIEEIGRNYVEEHFATRDKKTYFTKLVVKEWPNRCRPDHILEISDFHTTAGQYKDEAIRQDDRKNFERDVWGGYRIYGEFTRRWTLRRSPVPGCDQQPGPSLFKTAGSFPLFEVVIVRDKGEWRHWLELPASTTGVNPLFQRETILVKPTEAEIDWMLGYKEGQSGDAPGSKPREETEAEAGAESFRGSVFVKTGENTYVTTITRGDLCLRMSMYEVQAEWTVEPADLRYVVQDESSPRGEKAATIAFKSMRCRWLTLRDSCISEYEMKEDKKCENVGYIEIVKSGGRWYLARQNVLSVLFGWHWQYVRKPTKAEVEWFTNFKPGDAPPEEPESGAR